MPVSLDEIVMSINDELETKGVEEILEGCIEVRRIQSYINGKWETVGYELLLSCGGPTAWIETHNDVIIATWGSEKREMVVSGKAEAKLREIEDYLDEIAP